MSTTSLERLPSASRQFSQASGNCSLNCTQVANKGTNCPRVKTEQCCYTKDAEVKVTFVADASLYSKVVAATNGMEGIKEIYTFDEVAGAKKSLMWRMIFLSVVQDGYRE